MPCYIMRKRRSLNEKIIITLAIVMIGLAVLACIVSMIAASISASITTNFTADLRKEIFYKVQSISAAEIDRFNAKNEATQPRFLILYDSRPDQLLC